MKLRKEGSQAALLPRVTARRKRPHVLLKKPPGAEEQKLQAKGKERKGCGALLLAGFTLLREVNSPCPGHKHPKKALLGRETQWSQARHLPRSSESLRWVEMPLGGFGFSGHAAA